jgi:ATP-binding cassette subfamily B protein
MIATLVLAVLNGLSAGFYPLGFRLFTDAFLAHDRGGLIIAVVVTASLIAVNWTASNLDANLGIDLADRVTLYVGTRIAELVNGARDIAHFERPDYLQELDLVDENRGMIAGGPRQLLITVQTLVRAAGLIVLFASVHPVLLVLPAFGLLPSFGEAQSVRIRQRAEERMAEQKRLGDQLFAIAATAAPAKEVRIFGLAGELRARHAAIGSAVTRRRGPRSWARSPPCSRGCASSPRSCSRCGRWCARRSTVVCRPAESFWPSCSRNRCARCSSRWRRRSASC